MKRHFPATARNRDAILAVLREVLPAAGTVLEIASGSGEHAIYFAEALTPLRWLPSDPDEANLASIRAWRDESARPNLAPPIALDVLADPWPVDAVDAVVCINMIHIAPPEATSALLRGAASRLSAGARLVLYGPFKRGGAHTAPSNEAFDTDLRARDPRWGVRDLDDVAALAAHEGFGAPTVHTMPANNLTVIFEKR